MHLVFLVGPCALLLYLTVTINTYVSQHRKAFGLDTRAHSSRYTLAKELLRGPEVCKVRNLLVGSSRIRQLDHLRNGKQKFYSMTVGWAMADELEDLIAAWIHRCDHDPRVIVVGLDFYGYGGTNHLPEPGFEEQLRRVRSIADRWGVWEPLSPKRTYETLGLLMDPPTRAQLDPAIWLYPPVAPGGDASPAHARPNEDEVEVVGRLLPWRNVRAKCSQRVHVTDKIAPATPPEKFSDSVRYREAYADLVINPATRGVYRSLAERFPNSKIVAVIPPVSHTMWGLRLEYDLLPVYEDFLRSAVDGFGEVWWFDDLNSVSADRRNFVDENHLRASAADLMLGRALGIEELDVPEDFGVRVDADNVDEQIARLREQTSRPAIPPSARRVKRRDPVPLSEVSQRKPVDLAFEHDCTWEAPAKETRRGKAVVPAGLRVAVDRKESRSKVRLEVAVVRAHRWRIEYVKKGKIVGQQTLKRPRENKKLQVVVTLPIPKKARDAGYDEIRVIPTKGDLDVARVGPLRLR